MRGLTAPERDVLALMVGTDGDPHAEIPFPSEDIEATVENMVAQGRVRTFEREEEDGTHCIYTPTAAGRLALRLWPLTRAGVGQ